MAQWFSQHICKDLKPTTTTQLNAKIKYNNLGKFKVKYYKNICIKKTKKTNQSMKEKTGQIKKRESIQTKQMQSLSHFINEIMSAWVVLLLLMH